MGVAKETGEAFTVSLEFKVVINKSSLGEISLYACSGVKITI